MKKRWKCPKTGHFRFLGQQKDNRFGTPSFLSKFKSTE